jgi:2-keto-myo-inositol isomerase
VSIDRGAGPPAVSGTVKASDHTWNTAAAPRLTRRRFALHGGTTGALALPDHLATAKNAGFDAVEIGDDELTAYVALGGTLADVRTTLARLTLNAVSLYDSSYRTALGTWGDDGMRDRWRAFCARAAAVGCAHVLVAPGLESEAGSTQPKELAAALGAMADIAAEFELRTALEFRGFRGWAARSLAAARELVDTAGAEVRLVIDAFHFHTGAIALVRLVDADGRRPETLTDSDRLLPGDGVIPLRDLVRHVESLGNDLQYSVNLCVRADDPRDTRGYGQWSVSRLAMGARESAEALCAEVDEQDGRLDYA